MAGNRIDINLSVQDQGKTLQNRTNDAKNLNKELERAQNLISGTKTGNQAARRAGLTPGMEGPEVRDYNVSRGVSGGGGASARDFADQARGLGGLVRLYATWAANIFAVSAAFNALRDSMSTEMMVRGLDQLGAATGMAMGGIAKDFARASDGAISLREAMEATAKAMSSGMSQQQFMQLGAVAKGASQALGINMSDAVSRLTRGITKLEPELLDELGIFTKVGKATEDYARSIGKAEAQLTDFERRQAFANAVLKEGSEKFGAIAQEANPYDKLLAELKNTAQNILSVVNALITPIAKLLADNTNLIGAAIALAAFKLTKQALPELGRWQKGLKDAAEDAKERAKEINSAFQEAFVEKSEAAAGIPGLKKNVEQAKKDLQYAQRELAGVTSDKRTTGSGWFKEATTAEVLSEKTLTKLQEDQARLSTSNVENKKRQGLASERLLSAQQNLIKAEKELEKASQNVGDSMERRARIGSELWQREELLLNARSKAAQLDIRSRVGENVDKLGLLGGIGALINETKANKDINTLGKIKTIGVGSFTAIFRAAEILMSSLGRMFNIIAIGYTAFELLDSILSTNSKAAKEFTEKLGQLEEANKNAAVTAEKFKNSLSSEAIIAYSNSFSNLTKQLSDTIQGLKDLERESNWWDNFLDKIADWTIGFDSRNEKAGKQVGKTIENAIKLAPVGPARDALEKKYREILGIDKKLPINAKTVAKALDSISDAKFDITMDAVEKSTNEANKEFGSANKLLSGLKDAADATTKAFQNLSNSVTDKSPLQEFLTSSIRLSGQLSTALSDPNNLSKLGAAAFIDKIESVKGLNPALLQDFSQATLEFEKLNILAEDYRKTIFEAQAKLRELPAARGEIGKELQSRGGFAADIVKGSRREDPQEILRRQLQQTISTAETELQKITPELLNIQDKIRVVLEKSAQNSVDKFISTAKLGLSKLQVQAKQIVIELVPEAKTVETIQERMRLEKEAIEVERRLASIQLDLVLEEKRNTIALESLRSEFELTRLAEEMKKGNIEEDVGAQRQKELKAVIKTNEDILKAASGGSRGVEALMRDPVSASYREQLTQMLGLITAKDKANQEALNKTLQSEFKGRIDQLALVFQAKAKLLQDTYNSIAISTNILASGPEAEVFKEEVQLVLQRLKDQEKLLDFENTLAALQMKLEATRRVGGKTGVVETEIEGVKAKQQIQKQQQEEAENIRKAAFERSKSIKLLERETEVSIQLLNISKERIRGTTIGAEQQRVELDRRVRKLEQDLNTARRDKDLAEARDAASRAQAQLAQIGPGDLQDMSEAERLRYEALQGSVKYAERLAKVYAQLGILATSAESSKRFSEDIDIAIKGIEQYKIQLEAVRIIEQAREQVTIDALNDEIKLQDYRLERARDQYKITDDQYKAEKLRAEVRRIDADLAQKLAQNTYELAIAEAELKRVRAQEGPATEMDYVSGYTSGKSPEEERAEARLKALKISRQGFEDAASRARSFAEEQLQVFTREESYGQAFIKMFKNMEDAIVEFTQTGKFSFKSMVNSFLQDLLRFETNRLMRSLLSGLGGSESLATGLIGGTKSILSLFGFAGGGVANIGKMAKGYAMGGIVDKPTLFTFANGGTTNLGVAGEGKYSEAIVPLPDGKSIPVVMNGKSPQISISVNNYGKEQVDVKETTDGRGNPSIEFTIGNMAAGELSKTNSAMQRSFTNAFGIRPMVGAR